MISITILQRCLRKLFKWSDLPSLLSVVRSFRCGNWLEHFSTTQNIVVLVDCFADQLIPGNRKLSFCGQLRYLQQYKKKRFFESIYIVTDVEYFLKFFFLWKFKKLFFLDECTNLPIMELLFAINCLNFGILNTTDGNVMNELCEISNRNSNAKSANSSGSLDIWLWDRFRSIRT